MSIAARLNRWLERAWRSGMLPPPPLDFPRLRRIGEALRDRSWEEPLLVLLESLRSEAALNPIGRTLAYGQLAGALRQRVAAQRLWDKRPEIASLRLEAPVVVLGHMRSGTTRLQRLLACDDRLSHSLMFETMRPVPQRRPDLRAAKAAMGLALMHRLDPALAAIHPTSARAPEEEFGLFALSIQGAQYEAQWRVPSFTAWWERRDRAHVYAEFRMFMQTIAWARGPEAARPWVLKAPQFMEDLDLLLGAFPDARLIRLTRDPADVVGSSASLVFHQMQVQSGDADAKWVGAEWLRKTMLREAAAARVLGRSMAPAVEVTFEAMNRDWRSEMGRIYDLLGMPLIGAVERRMAAYLARAERSGFRGHSYRLDDYGLDAERVRNAVRAAI